ncbi:uncharacterized protein [Chelonus insularis]|uniref:uncharacterized protein n=1 Tax=Chelonus insularis TaxID=460826 RepID=UPI00158A6E98|nr:uncharacterized protein LOC118071929 [Chelonus insularis]
MSMLAEPRKKQKWTLNPQGKHWSDDNNKFGQKMLEKMGWTPGKGLGANENGMTEHIRVKHKDDQAGIGYSKDSHDKLWTEHQDGFNEFLKKLHNGEDSESTEKSIDKCDLSGKSLELKSKFSRARVHYHKFTRGKDVNKYSAKDLANIFGKKDLNVQPKEVLNEQNDEKNADTDSVGATDSTAGVLTIKGGTMTDYFKNKFPLMSSTPKSQGSKRKSEKEIDNDIDENNEAQNSANNSESEAERYVGFGYSNSNESNGKLHGKSKGLLNSASFVFANSPLNIKSSKSTPKKRKSEFYCSTPAMEEKKAHVIQEEYEETPKKRKTELLAFENPGLDMSNLDSPTSLPPSSSTDPIKSSKYEVILTENNPHEVYEEKPDELASVKKKKKKKRQSLFVEGFVNDGLDINTKDENNSTEPISSFPLNKMEVLRSEAIPIECIPRVSNNSQAEEQEPLKKKKKKKKKDLSIDGFVNDALNVDDGYAECSQKVSGNACKSFEVSRGDVFGLANNALDLTDETNGKKRVTFNDVVEYNTDSTKKKKKSSAKLDKFEVDIEKSKKKKKILSLNENADVNGFVNHALDVNIVNEEMIDNEENERKMNKERKKRDKGKKRMSNLETIEEVVEEEEGVNGTKEVSIINDKSTNEQLGESLVENTSNEFGEMNLETPMKKKKKKKSKEKEKLDENVDGCNELVEDQLENNSVSNKKEKKKKNKEIDHLDESNIKNEEQFKTKNKKKKKRKEKDESGEDKMEIDDDFNTISKENFNKENKNNCDSYEVLEEIEDGIEKKSKKMAKVDDINIKDDNNERSENIAKSQWESKSKPKKIFRTLFTKGPLLHFPGSSINEIKGYGMN